jgi:chromosomal replication initiator protein
MIATNVWDEILSRIQGKVNRHSFYTWFKPTAFVGDEGRMVTVRVPNGLFKDWITKHYSGVIAEALTEVKRGDVTVRFVAAPAPGPASDALGTPSRFPNASDALGTPSEGDALTLPVPEQLETIVHPATTPAAGLNPRYTFDTFIVGPSNQFADAACRAVAEAPSRSYNPLFIYGGVGLGKTHLMHAIGHYVLEHDRT